MSQIKYANLYVEHYHNGNLLLDFMSENEFIYFRNRGDYIDTMKLNQYSPTMILFNNIERINVQEGDIISVLMSELMAIEFDYVSNEHESINLAFQKTDGIAFSSLFERGYAFKNNKFKKSYIYNIKNTWNGTPCALDDLGDKFEVCVMDVRQGSANLIYDKNNLTIFDFGTSIHSSMDTCRSIISDHMKFLNDKSKISLILSHWDCDHYNLLAAVDDAFLNNLCCVFVPDTVHTLTAKQIVNRIEKNCEFIKTYSSPAKKYRGDTKMHIIVSKNNYTLFIGENNKSKNTSGVALSIFGQNDGIMLTADHNNRQVWSEIYPSLAVKNISGKLNLVVPHHGGKCGTITTSAVRESPGIAAISVGKNIYKHPTQSTIDTYEKLGFSVKRTDWERNDIIIQMV